MMTEGSGACVPQRNWSAERSRLNDAVRWELTTAERVVLDAIEVHIGQQAEGWPTQRRIGLQTGLSERQVRRVVESLVTRGYLAVRVVSELPTGEAGRGQRVLYRRGPRLEGRVAGGQDDRARVAASGPSDRTSVGPGGRDDQTSVGRGGHVDRTRGAFAGHGDRRFADMVSVKGSELKEISERVSARESREGTESERENAEGATRVLAALAKADAERRMAQKPADPVSAVLMSVLAEQPQCDEATVRRSGLRTSDALEPENGDGSRRELSDKGAGGLCGANHVPARGFQDGAIGEVFSEPFT